MRIKLFIGIDVSSKDMKACFMNTGGDTLHQVTVQNDLPGASHLKEKIISYYHKGSFQAVVIGMESTSYYSWHPAMFFQGDEELKTLNTKVFIINPKLTHHFRKYSLEMNKTDKIDAWFIADQLRFGRLPVSVVVEEQYMALQRLTRMRFYLVHNQTREKQLFLQHLFFKCSSFTTEVESAVFGHALTELLLERYTLDEISSMELINLSDYLQEKSKNKFADPECLARSIQKATRTSYRLPKTVEDSIDLLLVNSIESIRSIKDQIKRLDKAIEIALNRIPNTLQTIPGIGPVFAAGIISEIGGIIRFKDNAAVAKYAGLVWKKHQSGSFQAEDTNIVRTGNRYLRYYLVEAANSVRVNIPEYKEFYSKKYHEVPKHRHKRALVLTARKLVRLIDTLLRKNQIYTPR
jgi:transposase